MPWFPPQKDNPGYPAAYFQVEVRGLLPAVEPERRQPIGISTNVDFKSGQRLQEPHTGPLLFIPLDEHNTGCF